LPSRPGDPAGIGPDICLRLLDDARAPRFGARIVVLADRSLLAERAAALNLPGSLRDWNPSLPAQPGTLDVLHLPLAAAARPGCLDPANAPYVLALLDRAWPVAKVENLPRWSRRRCTRG
jgi:4-hydroxythreonine-4-phosphate dehydrogenase